MCNIDICQLAKPISNSAKLPGLWKKLSHYQTLPTTNRSGHFEKELYQIIFTKHFATGSSQTKRPEISVNKMIYSSLF